MHPVVNHLIQLQELTLIRDEQKIAGNSEHLEQLDQSILALAGQLPPETRGLYEKLHRRDHVVIVPISLGVCAGCGMQLPISLVQAVRMAREVMSCPNCAKMLYEPEARPRRVSAPPSRTARGVRSKPGISRFSSEALMVPRLAATGMEEAIRELAGVMQANGFVDDAGKLVEAALRREAVLSTVLDNGLAVPHVRGVEGGGLALALGISPRGMKLNSPDGKPTRMVFFIVIPTAASAFYLKLLAGVSETFRDADNRKAVLDESNREGLWKALCKVTRATIK